MDVDPKLLELLVCPVSKMPVRYNASSKELISDTARLAYPIRDGVPVMMQSQARALKDEEVKK